MENKISNKMNEYEKYYYLVQDYDDKLLRKKAKHNMWVKESSKELYFLLNSLFCYDVTSIIKQYLDYDGYIVARIFQRSSIKYTCRLVLQFIDNKPENMIRNMVKNIKKNKDLDIYPYDNKIYDKHIKDVRDYLGGKAQGEIIKIKISYSWNKTMSMDLYNVVIYRFAIPMSDK